MWKGGVKPAVPVSDIQECKCDSVATKDGTTETSLIATTDFIFRGIDEKKITAVV